MQTAEKQEFIAYLEKSGVIDILTKAFVNLFEEHGRPENPLNFIKESFGENKQDLEKENAALKERVKELENQVAELTKQGNKSDKEEIKEEHKEEKSENKEETKEEKKDE